MSTTRARVTVLLTVLLALTACALPARLVRQTAPLSTPLAESAPATRVPGGTVPPTVTARPWSFDPTTASTYTSAEVASDFVILMNDERSRQGLPVLTRDPHLDAMAQEYAAGGLDDAILDTSDLRYLMANSWWTAYHGGTPRLGPETAQEQLDYSLGEERMKEAILHPEARSTGIGIAVLGDTVYFSQAFDVLATRGGDGEMIVLHENPQAQDPTWEALVDFLARDDTDSHTYVDGSFVCSDFAEMLHNRAEEAGIRCAYVAVELGEGPGHALNAFHVGDRDVFVDVIEGDKVACLQVGRPLGVMSLAAAARYSCERFDEYSQLVSDYLTGSENYGASVQQYNAEIGQYDAAVETYNRQPTGEEYERLAAWSTRLDEQAAWLDAWDQELRTTAEGLGIGETYWAPVGSLVGAGDSPITDVYMHW